MKSGAAGQPKSPSKSSPPAQKKPAAKAVKLKVVAKKSTAKVAKKNSKPAVAAPRKDRRGTPKGKATGVGKGRGGGGKIGNPKFVPTDEQRALVLSHAATATPYPIIAEELKIGESTLKRYFAKELEQGLPRANSRLGGVVYKEALAGNLRAVEMWFDRRGGVEWRKKSGVELSGPNGGAIRHEELSMPADFSKLPIEKRRLLEKLLLEAEAGQADEPS